MPLTTKGEEIKANMEKEYGPEKGESVFYASKNKGTISGVDGVPVGDCYRADAPPGTTPEHQSVMKKAEISYREGGGKSWAHAPASERSEHVKKVSGGGGQNHDPSTGRFDEVPVGDCYRDALPGTTPEHQSVMKKAEAAYKEGGGKSWAYEPASVRAEHVKKASGGDSEPPAYNSQPLIDPVGIGGMGPYGGSTVPKDAEPSTTAKELTERAAGHYTKGEKEKGDYFASLANEHLKREFPHRDTIFNTPAQAHDYSGDAGSPLGGLPQTFSHEQMVNFGASFNYGEGVKK